MTDWYLCCRKDSVKELEKEEVSKAIRGFKSKGVIKEEPKKREKSCYKKEENED